MIDFYSVSNNLAQLFFVMLTFLLKCFVKNVLLSRSFRSRAAPGLTRHGPEAQPINTKMIVILICSFFSRQEAADT